jgi:hypothetical protein
MGSVNLVNRIKLELDLFPAFHSRTQFRAALGRCCKDILAFLAGPDVLIKE